MNDIISEYQKWKQQGDELRLKAKQALETRYRELLMQAVQIAEEYREDFGSALKPPPLVTAFRYKAHAKTKPKKNANPKSPAPNVNHPATGSGEVESETGRDPETIDRHKAEAGTSQSRR